MRAAHDSLVHCAFHQRESTNALQWYPSKTVLTDTDLETTAVYQFCGTSHVVGTLFVRSTQVRNIYHGRV